MRFISSSSVPIFSSNRAFFDFGGSLPRNFSSAFSTESLVVSAMAITLRPGAATCRLGENLQPDIVPSDNSAIRVSRILFECECVRPHSTHRALMRVDGPGYPQVRGRYARRA